MSQPTFVQKEQRYISFDEIPWEDRGGGVRRKVMCYGDQLMGVYVEFAQGAVGALHSHPHVQFTYIKEGRFTVHIGAETREQKAGDFYYIPPDIVHGVVALEPGVLVDVFTPMREDFLPARG